PSGDDVGGPASPTPFFRVFQRPLDTVDELLLLDRLLQKINRSKAHRLDRHRHIAMASNEDNGNMPTGFDQVPLQIDPADPRHAYIEHQAAAIPATRVVEELSRIGVCLYRDG